MKKLTKLMLTLALLVMGVTGAKAEWVEDYSIDYSTKSNFPFYVMGYVPEWVSGVMTDYGAMYTYKQTSALEDGENVVGTAMAGSTEYSKIKLTEPRWHQYFIADGIPTSVGGTYTVKAMVKASEAVTINVNMGWGWGDDEKVSTNVLIGTDWAEVEWSYTNVGGTSCNLVAQPGTTTATIEWKSLTVSHEISTELQDRPEPDAPAAPQWGTSIKVIDYSTQESYPYWWMGDRIDKEPNQPYFCNGSATVQIVNNALQIANTQVQTNFWDLQPFIIDNVTMREGYEYVVRIKMNTTGAGNARVVLGTWDNDYYKDFNFADDYAYYDIELGTATFSADNNAHALLQCGSFAGKIAIGKVEVFEVLPKQELSDKIALAKKYNGMVYTTASFAELTSAIATAETALDEATDPAAVQSATNALTDAIDGLQLAVGYANLTADMYKHHESLENPGEGTSTGCAYAVGESTGQPYGDSQVHYLNWADLSAYKKLVILVADGTPRIMMNRQAPLEDTTDPNYDSHGSAYVQLTEAPVDGVVEVDLTQYSYAHLNAIKGANWQNVTVLGMYLYRDMNYGIIGDLTGGWDTDVDMTPTATEGEYTLTVNEFKATKGTEYKYKLRTNDVYGIYDLPNSGDYTWTCGQSGTYSLTFTADVLNHNLTLTAEKVINSMTIVGFTPDTEDAEKWNPANGIAMTQDANDSAIWTAVVDKYVVKKVNNSLYYQYKAVANGSYGEFECPVSGNQNYDFASAGEGLYKLTFTANTTAKSVELAVEKLSTATIYFVNTNGWPAENIKAYVWNASGNNKWPGETMTATNEKIDGKDVYSWSTYSLDLPTNIIISNNGSDSERTGDQTFVNGATYRADGSATVTKTITAAGYATFYCTKALNFEGTGLTAYIGKMDASNKVTFSPVDNVPANTGVLLKGDAGTYTINTIASSGTDVEGNVLKGVTVDTQVAPGIFVLLNGDKGVGFYKTTKTFTVGANTAYIEALPNGARTFIGFDFNDNTTTAIEGVATVKENNGEIYNLQGQRVVKAQKGLYIINGKKVLVK